MGMIKLLLWSGIWFGAFHSFLQLQRILWHSPVCSLQKQQFQQTLEQQIFHIRQHEQT